VIRIPVKDPKRSVPWQVPVALLVFAGLVLGLIAFALILRWERRQLRTTFDGYARERFVALEQKMDALIEDAEVLRGLFDTADDGVDETEFDSFSRTLHDRQDDVSYGWARRVTGETPKPFGESPADEQILIHYIEPSEVDTVIRQIDLDADGVRLQALLRACDTGEVTVASKAELFGDARRDWDYAVFMPVYRDGAAPDSVEARRRSLTGFVFATCRVAGVVERAMAPLDPQGIDVLLLGGSGDEEQPVATYLSPSSELSAGREGLAAEDFEAGVHSDATFDSAGYRWHMMVRPTPERGKKNANESPGNCTTRSVSRWSPCS
jgi:CHASE1-domain containing sensor protein